MSLFKRYCLDTNVLVEAWNKYYSPDLCPSYWERLNELGIKGVIFVPEKVANEIHKTEDDLSRWLKVSSIPVEKADTRVTQCLTAIFAKDPNHRLLVDSKKGRSEADPWVIAHAMATNAIVVTKEEMITATNTKQVKIPNVCKNMNVRCINDFDLAKLTGIQFDCTFKPNIQHLEMN